MIDTHEKSTPRQRARVWATVLALSLSLGWATAAMAEPTTGEIGAAAGNIYASPSIAEDAAGAAHIAWKSGPSQISIHKISTSREITPQSTYQSPVPLGDRLGIVIDGSDTHHLFFQAGPSLYLASLQGDTWNTTTVWTSPNNRTLAMDPVITSAPNGTAYIAFVVVNNENPANRTHSLLFGEVGQSPGEILSTNSATEEWDNPSIFVTNTLTHIAITRRDAATFTSSLYYGNNGDDTWDFSPIAEASAPDDQTPIRVHEANGAIQIAYHDADQNLHLATSSEGTEWTDTLIEGAQAGAGVSFAQELSTSVIAHTYEEEDTSYLHISTDDGEGTFSNESLRVGSGVLDETASTITEGRLHVSIYQRWDTNNTRLSAYLDSTNNAPFFRQDNPAAFSLTQNQQDFSFSLEVQDQDGDRLSWTISSQGRSGMARLSRRDGYSNTVEYVPNRGFQGEDSVQITVSDDYGGSATITANLTVESPPLPPVITPPSANVMMEEDGDALDTQWTGVDPNRTPVSFSIVQEPANGMVSLTSENGAATTSYTPNANFNGTDSYTLRATDGEGAFTDAVVTLNIASVNDAPTLSQEQVSLTISEDNSPNAFALTAEATDVDDESLTWSISQQGAHGAAAVDNGVVSYTPEANYHGSDSFILQVADDQNGTDTLTVQLTIESVNDLPEQLSLDNATIAENLMGGTTIGTLSAVDVDQDDITWSLVDGEGDADNDNFSLDGAMLLSTGELNFEAGAERQIRVEASDGTGAAAQNFTITITNNNDAPTALIIDPGQLLGNETEGESAGTLQAVDEDSDDQHTYTLVEGQGDDDNEIFRVDEGELVTANDLTVDPDRENYSVRIQVEDSAGATYTEALEIEVTGVEQPMAADDTYSTAKNTALEVSAPGVLDNDRGPSDTPLSAVLVTPPAGGTLDLREDGSFTYNPDEDFAGVVTFTYQAEQSGTRSENATVTITVEAEDNPVEPEDDMMDMPDEDMPKDDMTEDENNASPDMPDDETDGDDNNEGTINTTSSSGGCQVTSGDTQPFPAWLILVSGLFLVYRRKKRS